jgi:two-component system osmolarity sensor histidine kinase EnvZ
LADTIARRFALTEILAVAVTLGMVLIFNQFGGALAQEPLDRTGLLNEAADIVRMIEAAPPEARQAIAAAAGTEAHQVYRFPAGSPGARALEITKGHNGVARRIVAEETHRTVVVLDPMRQEAVPPGLDLDRAGAPEYLLGVRLQDQSWAVFTTSNRSWGISESARWAMRLMFLAVSISVFTVLAAKQFAAPIKELAAAVREFGVNPRAPPIPEAGPRELRQVIGTFNEMQAQIQKFVAYRTTSSRRACFATWMKCRPWSRAPSPSFVTTP